MMTCLHFYVLYIISVSSGRWEGDDGKQCDETPFTVEKISVFSFRRESSRDGLIIKPALNPHSATGHIERQRDKATANQRDKQIFIERERDIERRDEYSFA